MASATLALIRSSSSSTAWVARDRPRELDEADGRDAAFDRRPVPQHVATNGILRRFPCTAPLTFVTATWPA